MTQALRVLLTHIYSWPEVRRGGERYMHEVGAALRAAGHEVRIESTAPIASYDEVIGVPVRRLARREGDALRYRELAPEVAFGAELFRRNALCRIDVWHAFGTADAAAAARLSRMRRFPRVRSVYTDLGGPSRTYRESRPDHGLFRYAVKHLDAYLCLSEATRQLLENNYQRRGLIVSGGVDLDRFATGARRTPEPTLLFTSALDEPRKNLSMLLAAFDRVLAVRPTARLQLCGPGDAAPALATATAAVREATDVLGLGQPGDLERLYGEAWATVLPSMHEAFGLVLVESLATGTPIVGIAGSGGPAEIVTPSVGTLATTETPDALAAACLAALALAERGDDTRRACRAEAEQRYGWRETIVPRLEMVYRGTLSG